MRGVLFLPSLFLSAALVLLPAQAAQDLEVASPGARAGDPVATTDVDLSPLQGILHAYRTDLSQEELDGVARTNFYSIYFTRLTTEKLLDIPQPEEVADKILLVFRLNEEIGALIRQGRALAVRGSSDDRWETARRISRSAGQISGIFGEFFLDTRYPSYELEYTKVAEEPAQFVHYLLAAGRISGLLSRSIQEYFFDLERGSPKTVRVDVLAKSMVMLEELLHP